MEFPHKSNNKSISLAFIFTQSMLVQYSIKKNVLKHGELLALFILFKVLMTSVKQ